MRFNHFSVVLMAGALTALATPAQAELTLNAGARLSHDNNIVVDAPQGASIKTTQGVGTDTGIAAPPKIGNDKAGFGSGSGMGSGGGAGSPSSLTGSMGSPVGNSGGGSQTFGGGLPGTSPLSSTPPAGGAGGPGMGAMRP